MKNVSNILAHILYWIVVVASAVSELIKKVVDNVPS